MIEMILQDILNNRSTLVSDKAERILYLKNILMLASPKDAGINMLEEELISIGYCPVCGNKLTIEYDCEYHDEVDAYEYLPYSHCEKCGKDIV